MKIRSVIFLVITAALVSGCQVNDPKKSTKDKDQAAQEAAQVAEKAMDAEVKAVAQEEQAAAEATDETTTSLCDTFLASLAFKTINAEIVELKVKTNKIVITPAAPNYFISAYLKDGAGNELSEPKNYVADANLEAVEALFSPVSATGGAKPETCIIPAL